MTGRPSIRGRHRSDSAWVGGRICLLPGGTDRSTRLPDRERGFSVLEILVVLALFGLISALLIGGSGSLLRMAGRDDVENVAITAIANVRNDAVVGSRTLDLQVDEKARSLEWGNGRAAIPGEGEVRLLPPVTTSSVLIGGRVSEATLGKVRFYADGTCDPFRLEIIRDNVSHIVAIDPWTCTVLAPDKTPGHH